MLKKMNKKRLGVLTLVHFLILYGIGYLAFPLTDMADLGLVIFLMSLVLAALGEVVIIHLAQNGEPKEK